MVEANPGWAELWIVEGGGSHRPALVLTRPEASDRLERLLVAFATTAMRGLVSEVAIGPDEGVDRECVLNFDTPELLSRSRFVRFVADFPARRWTEVGDALGAAINC